MNQIKPTIPGPDRDFGEDQGDQEMVPGHHLDTPSSEPAQQPEPTHEEGEEDE